MSTAETGGAETPEPPPVNPWASPPSSAAPLTDPAALPISVTVPAPAADTVAAVDVAMPASAPPAIPVQPGPPTAPSPAPATGVPVSSIPYPVSAYPVSSYPVSAYPMPYPVSAPAAYPPLYGYPPGYLYPQPPPARSNALRWVVAVVALLIVAAGGTGGGLLYGVATTSIDAATWKPAPGLPNQSPPPAANASPATWDAWAAKTARDASAAQAKALTEGDQAGYMAIADPTNIKLVDSLRTRFANLRAMGLGRWTQAVGSLSRSGDKVWSASLTITYCFGESTCDRAMIEERTGWSIVKDRLVLSKLDASTAEQEGPRPWETDQLSVKTGKRVVVAATKSNAWRVDQAATMADRAAAISDTFAKWAPPPSRYVIFFAGPNDWSRWYGADEPEWAAGWSVPVADNVTEIVIRSDVVPTADLQVLLTHEMTHVTTLAGPQSGLRLSAWWLVEGIAEYASHLRVPFREYDGVQPTTQWVRSKWDGNPAVSPPDESADQVEAGGKYGVAYLSVRRLAEKYGKEKMMDFWGRVVHEDESVDTAARAAFGAPWTTLKADCAKYVRDQVALAS